MPQAPPKLPLGSYDFGKLGRVSGLRKPDGSYPSQEEALRWFMKHRPGDLQVMTPDEKEEAGKVPTDPEDMSIPSGIIKRAGGTLQGLFPLDDELDFGQMLAAPGKAALSIPPNYLRAVKQLGGQVGHQAKAYDPRAIISALALADPFATQTVADVNKLKDEGRSGEAAGAGIFDIFTMLPGLRLKSNLQAIRKGPRFTPQVESLTSAVHPAVDPADFQKVAGELNATARMKGRPNTVEALQQTVTDAKSKLDSDFNLMLHPIRKQPTLPIQIAHELMKEANKPNLSMTAEGRAARSYLRKRAIEFSRPWTLEALNEERSKMSAQRQGFYSRTSEKQSSGLRGDVEQKADSIVENGLKDIVYGAVEKANPGAAIREMKAKQSALISIESGVKDKAQQLRTSQAAKRGAPLRAKATLAGYESPGSLPRARLGGLQKLIPGMGPESVANAAVRKAFPSAATKTLGAVKGAAKKVAPLAPKDREKSLRAQLAVAERIKHKAWAERLNKLLKPPVPEEEEQ